MEPDKVSSRPEFEPPTRAERRQLEARRHDARPGGRRHADLPSGGQAWTVQQLAHAVQMSPSFILGEIRDGRLLASKFGSEYRIADAEVRRYFAAKGFPYPVEGEQTT